MSVSKKKAKKDAVTIQDLDADSDASDSDYNPDSDLEADKEEVEEKQESLLHSGISASRKRKANDMFEEMRAADEAATQAKLSKAFARPVGAAIKVKKAKTAAATDKKKQLNQMMQSVFGTSGSGSTARPVVPKPETAGDLKAQLKAYAANVMKNTTVVETRKFAGQEITVERTLKVGESTSSTVKKTEPVASSQLDKILEDLKGPQTVSAVTKSVYDWDNYKEKEGLEDDLAVAAKDGYLHRQDFLQRCDVREHDKEVAARPPPAPVNR